MTSPIEMSCPGCRAPLSFPPDAAGATGPCYSCGIPVTVPAPAASPAPPPAAGPIVIACAQCGTASEFDAAMIGQSGPCRTCGATMTVTAPGAGMHPPAPPPGALEVAPNPAQRSAAGDIAKEATKVGMQVLGNKVVQIAQDVTMGENVGAALKARFLFGGQIRTDRVLATKLRAGDCDFYVVVPFSGNMVLAHEMASVIPGVLPSNLWLSRGLLGAWSSGRWLGSEGGEQDPLAEAAEREYSLVDGIEWDWEQGRMRIKLHWGLQAVPATPSSTLYLVKTAQRGIVFKDFGLNWYLERRRAFMRFVQTHGAASSPHAPAPSFHESPLSSLFLDEIVGTP